MFVLTLRKSIVNLFLVFACFLNAASVFAGGIVLGGTRVIYPAGQKESSISVRNTSDDARYMVQSWVEDAQGKKTNDFIVTPPLYVSNPKNESYLRMMYVGESLPKDRETLYYFVSNAIPALDKAKTQGKNMLMLSASTRIKLFVRPAGLSPSIEKAAEMLTFTRHDRQVTVNNPTPYYITLVQMKAGQQKVKNLMVSPYGQASFALASSADTKFSYRTMNDYGGMTTPVQITLK